MFHRDTTGSCFSSRTFCCLSTRRLNSPKWRKMREPGYPFQTGRLCPGLRRKGRPCHSNNTKAADGCARVYACLKTTQPHAAKAYVRICSAATRKWSARFRPFLAALAILPPEQHSYTLRAQRRTPKPGPHEPVLQVCYQGFFSHFHRVYTELIICNSRSLIA